MEDVTPETQQLIETEQEDYPLKNHYLLKQIIEHHLPEPVLALVRDYFNKTFAAHPWYHFDAGLPRAYAIDIFLAWLCAYEPEQWLGKPLFPYSVYCVHSYNV